MRSGCSRFLPPSPFLSPLLLLLLLSTPGDGAVGVIVAVDIREVVFWKAYGSGLCAPPHFQFERLFVDYGGARYAMNWQPSLALVLWEAARGGAGCSGLIL